MEDLKKENNIDVGILGAPFDLGTQARSGSRYGPRSIREISMNFASRNYNYDLDANILPSDFKAVDFGDVDVIHYDADECLNRIESSVSKLLKHQIMPVILGGDHSVTIPNLRAFKDQKPFTLIQLDSHLDYVDSITGVSQGQGSPIRRAAELDVIENIVQIGINGAGSSKKEHFIEAEKEGNIIIGAKEWKNSSTEDILAKIPDSERYYITLDLDVMDATVAPGVGSTVIGGMHHERVSELLSKLPTKGEIIGFDVVELCPYNDPAQVTALIAATLTLDLISDIYR